MIKPLIQGQHVCTEKDAKGKRCDGSLKEYFPFAKFFSEQDAERLREIEKELGSRDKNVPLLRCQNCTQLYYHPYFQWE